MTESEAMTKWCPMTHKAITTIVGPDSQVHRAIAETEMGGAKCIGSACMMWREHVMAVKTGTTPDKTYHEGTSFDGARYVYEQKVVGGYCGLAGKP